jgi:hypothetical protein
MSQENTVRYWHAVELLQPQSAPKLEKRDSDYASFFHDITVEQLVMPWSSDSVVAAQALPKNRTWSHTLYAHLYDSRDVASKLKELYGSDEGYKEPQSRESALFLLKFTADGLMVPDSLVLSSEAWFLGRALANKDWTDGFDDDQRAMREQINPLMGGLISADALRKLLHVIRDFLGVSDFFGNAGSRRLRFRSAPIKTNKPEQEDDPLNSFLLADLSHVAQSLHQGITSTPLDHYLQVHEPKHRLHLDTDDASLPLIERLMPDSYSKGCWPSEGHRGLVHSQQIAVNTILGQLADGKGLLGVNGPPGTGKTTLLRDLIAAIVTRRADVLANLRRASDAFVADGREKANDGGKPQAVYRLKADLYGFEIVVASANNGAVENVTLELPQKDKIDESWLPDADYFGDLGERVSGKPAWALISAALGSKTRRNDFVKSYFYGEPSKRAKPTAEETTAVAEPEEGDDNDVDVIEDSDEIGEIEAADVIAPTAVAEPRGFLRWLTKHADIERSTDQRLHIWEQAVAEYRAAQRRVEQTAASTTQIRGIVQSVGQSRQDASRQSATLEALRTKSGDVARRAVHLDAHDWKSAHAELQAVLQSLESHAARKPTFWNNLLSLGRHGRVWSAMHQTLTQRHALADAGFLHVNRQAKQLEAERKTLEQSTIEGTRILEQMQARVQQLIAQATEIATSSRATHLLTWLKTGDFGRGPAIELEEPWIIEPWRQARAGLFIQALKLHRNLFELEAKRFRWNLSFINSMLTGGGFQGVSRDAIRSAWASLFMVVPVLSSTFASFARSFGSLSAGEIGWLFVDEAGQATPQAAVGALWRSRRAVLVGDPLQLKPIVTVSDAVLEYMRTRYDVAPHWLPNRQSAQTLADQATTWGRLMGPADNKTWVGLPLVVHRRCDRPMYELANRIAYDGAMVYGTLAPSLDKETPASLATGWIHAAGTSTGNWVPAEGRALRQLVAQLQSDGVALNDISVITPFKAVRDQLKRLLPSGVVRGTIHTMQGKESAVVIIVLGGNTASPGARDWAVSEPNLLNVAVTRAKRRLYVIGDVDDWKSRRLFCDVMELLPLQASPLETPPMRLAL